MHKQSFLKGSAVLMIMVFITKALGLIYKIPLTSMLGGSGMSCYSGAFAVFTPIFAAAAAGIPGALSRLVSEQTALGRYKNAVMIKRVAGLMYGAGAAMLTLVLVVSAPMLAKFGVHDTRAKWAIVGVGLSLVPAALMNVRRGWAEGLGSMTPTAASEIVETACKLIFGLLGAKAVITYAEKNFLKYHGCFGEYCTDLREVHITAAPYAAAAAALGIAAASAAAYIYIVVRLKRFDRAAERELKKYSLPRDMGIRTAAKELLRFSVPSSLTAVTATLAGLADLTTIMPGLKKAMSESGELFAFLGAYGIAEDDRASFVYGSYTGLALTIYGLLPTFTAMLGKSVLPSLTAACARRDTWGINKDMRSVFLLSSAIALPGGIGICILPRELLTLFFGGRAAEIAVSSRPLAILGAAVIFSGLSLPCLTALQACSKQAQAALITLTGTVLKFVLNFILIRHPSLNISGAAISTAVSQAVICVAAVVTLMRGTGADKACLKAMFTPLLPAMLCSFAAILTQNIVVSHFEGIFARCGVVLSIALGAITCAISFALLCISPKNEISDVFLKKFSKSP